MKNPGYTLLAGFLCAAGALAVAQQQPPPIVLQPIPKAKEPPQKPKEKEQEQPFILRLPVNLIALPVTFLYGNGDFVTDVERPEVTVTDNKVAQRIQTFEVAYQPLSMVILVDTSSRMEGVIPNLRKCGILFTQLVMGETGEAAFVTYDHDVDVKQDFTTNGDLIEKAFKNLRPGAGESRMTDGVFRALGMVTSRQQDRRKVIVILGEGRDLGSESRKAQALREAQLANVSIYAVELSSFKAMAKRDLPQTTNDPIPTAASPREPGVPLAANSGVHTFDLWPALVETTRAGKALLWDHPLKNYTGGTGSDHINATSTQAVELAVKRIGNELHSQYWLSYTPNNLNAQEFHTIEVKINRPDVKVRFRPGYMYIPVGSEVTDPDKIPK